MKWKTILLFSLAVLLIAGSFAVPPMLLRGFISQAVNKPVLTEASMPDIELSGTIAEKLKSLVDPELTSVELSRDDNNEQLLRSLHDTLGALRDSGAISQAVYVFLYTAISEGFDAARFCLIQPDRHLMFEVYSIHCLHHVELVLDLSSEKILSIGFELPDKELLALEMDRTQADRELQGWADYLGMEPGLIRYSDFSPDEIAESEEMLDHVMLKEITLIDADGNGICFRQTYESWNGDLGYCSWQPEY